MWRQKTEWLCEHRWWNHPHMPVSRQQNPKIELFLDSTRKGIQFKVKAILTVVPGANNIHFSFNICLKRAWRRKSYQMQIRACCIYRLLPKLHTWSYIVKMLKNKACGPYYPKLKVNLNFGFSKREAFKQNFWKFIFWRQTCDMMMYLSTI